jgi:hypothetical protein
VVEMAEAGQGWGGDENKAVELAIDGLGPELERRMYQHPLFIPGPKFVDKDTMREPHNDERQHLAIGLYKGLKSIEKKPLTETIERAPDGYVSNYLARAAKNELTSAIRATNSQLGVEPGLFPSGREVLEQPVGLSEPGRSLLDVASDQQGFEQWRAQEEKETRRAYAKEKVSELASKVQLTRRQRLVVQLWDKDDTEVAGALGKAFGKPVRPGAVRALRHDVLVKLRGAAKK